MKSDLVITGTGLITPLGADVETVWRALLAGEFIRDHARVPLNHVHPSRVHQLALIAARQAIKQARWGTDTVGDPRTALVIGTSKGPVEQWLIAPPEVSENRRGVVGGSLCYGLAELSSYVAGEIHLGAGPRSTLSAACASSIHALLQASILIRSGQVDRALVIGAEASVHPLFIGSFKRLGVLPREGAGCHPFDLDRDGFLISEAAGAVCIERPKEGMPAIARIEKVAIAGDATHLTGSDPEGKVLRYLLKQVVGDQPIDLIHAHATGTPLNDPVELASIEGSLGHHLSTLPNIYSHKGAIGHSLGAAGLVSVVLNCQSHQTGTFPGNVQTRQPLRSERAVISRDPVQRPVRRSIAIAAGFGGATGVISMSKA